MVSDSRQLFNLIEKDIMRSSAWKMKPGKFRLETQCKFFFQTVRIINHRNNLPRNVVDSPTPEVFKLRFYLSF